MKKYLYQFFVALLALVPLTLVSCSEDEGNGGDGNTIEINGKEYRLSRFVESAGSWEQDTRSGKFTVSVERDYYGTVQIDYYQFDFSNATCPKTGDDVSGMNLVLTPMTFDSDDPLWDNEYTYVSGHARVTKTNPEESELTVRFENLVMNKDGKKYSFNGTATMLFFFYGF